MKSILLTLSLLITTTLFSQSVLFQEDFEGTVKMTSLSSGSGDWIVNTRLQSQGLKSDSATVTQGDTTYLTMSSSIDATGSPNLELQFSQIAKVELFDKCFVEVSTNGGTTWTQLTSNEYLGAGLFLNNSFSVGSYPIEWDANDPSAQPQNSWWKTELFNISAIAGNSANVKVRFVLIDANNNGSSGHAGWFIDNVILYGGLSELTPPSISMVWPSHLDTLTQGTDYQIKAEITDASGIDTAVIAYVTSTGVVDTVAMLPIATDTFQGTIPFIGFDRFIDYRIIAIDQSPAANMTTDPATGFHRIVSKPSPGIGFVAYQQGFENGFPIDWTQVNYDNMDWTRNTGATSSPGTGPIGAYEGSYYMYTKALNNYNKSAVIETPQFDLSSIYKPMVSFWYHMYGATMGDLHFEVLTANGVWVDLWSVSGGQQTSNGDAWREAVVDVSGYQSDTVQFRFRGETGSNYKSDMAIDDFKLVGSYLLATDIGVDQILNPVNAVMTNTPMPVQLTFSNFGSDTITSATIGWTLDGVSQTPYSYTGSLVHGAQTPSITIGNSTLTSGTHTIKTWTENPNGIADFNFHNDSMEVSFYACDNLLSGVYTINPNGSGATNYHSFADAILALSQCGVAGPVTFNVASGVYNEQLSLLPINGASATNTITFQSAVGDSSTVVLKYDANGAADNYVVKLDGTSYITFKDMSIVAENSVYARVFVLDNYVHDLSITNSVVKSEILSGNNSDNKALVYGIDSVGDDIHIQNSRLVNGYYAVYLEGGAMPSNGWDFTNNRIDGYYYSGVYLKNAKSAVINNNYMQADTNSTVSDHKGIYLLKNSGSTVVSNNEVYSKLTAKSYGIRISDCSFDVNSPASIYNNMVQTHSTNNAGCGILLNNTENCNLYYNTVNAVGSASGNAALMLLKNNGGTFNNVNIVNNIFTNADGYLIKTSGVDIAEFSNNYNDLYNFSGTKFISYNGDEIADLATWQSESGEGANSVDYNPHYIAVGDLHISNNQLNGIAAHIAGITTDIDGDVRNTSNPDMGADEFAASPNDIYAIDFEAPMGDCGLTNAETVAVRFKNIGSAAISSFNAQYQVIGSSTIVSETVSAAIAPGATFLYTFNTKVDLDVNATGVDSTFKITAWGTLTGDSDHTNDTTFTEVLSGFVPDTIHVDNDTILYLQSDTLYVSGINPYWWASDTSTIELAKDTILITGPLSDTTTYWVSDRAISGVIDVQVGNGTVTNSGYSYPSPYANGFWGNKEQYLFLASELTAMGISAGPLSGIQFDVAAVNSVPTLNNYEISVGSTSDNALTTWITGLTTVYSPGSYTPTNGWNEHQFTTPFIWDGVSNIVVQVCFNNASYASNGNASVNSTVTTFNSVLNYHADNSNVCQNSSISSNISRTQRPNIKFTTTALGCFSDRTPVTVVVTGFPEYDASLDPALLEPTGSVPSGVKTAIKAVLKNFGQVDLTSVKIPYSINGVVEDTITWTGNLPYNMVDTIVIDSVNFKGGVYNITAYTMMPNGVVDTINANDTATTNFSACMSGTFTIGDTINGNADFGSFSNAVHVLGEVGVCGNVVFNVEAGTYNERFVLEEVAGAGQNSTITFQSASGDSTSVILIDTATSSSNNYVIKFDGADYFTFQNMTIKAGGTTYARLIDISNESDHNTFANNVFEMPVSATPNVCAVYSYGSNDNYLTITNNHIINGGYAIYLHGVNPNNREKGLIVDGNIIEGFGTYGVNVNNMDSTIITNNKLVAALGSNQLQAVYLNFIFDGFVIANNNIQITQGGGYSAVYGLRLNNGNAQAYASGLATGYVYNNMINIRAGSGAKFGLYSYYCDNVNFYYNTVNISGQGSSGRALYQYNSNASSNGEIFINNNFIDSTGGYAAYFSNFTTVNISDFNNFYSEGGDVAYLSGAKNTLADLQAVSGKDAHSISVLPLFRAPDDLHVITTNIYAKGTPIGFITTDIDGELRDVNQPTIGADEVYPIPVDAGVETILNPKTTLNNVGSSLDVRVRNYGTDTINSIDVSYILNGAASVTITYNTTAIAPRDSMDISFGSITFQEGLNTICAYTTLTGDTNTFNDTLCKSTFVYPTVSLDYTDDFEGLDLWMADTVVNQWERGVPSMTNINSAHSSANVWGIDLDGQYANNSSEYLYSPRIVTTGLDSAILKFWNYFDTQSNDGGVIQVSVDDGPWITLGLQNDPLGTNWYNSSFGGNPCWSGNSSGWVESTYKLMLNNTTFNHPDAVQFRFHFFSNAYGNISDGWAIDDFSVEIFKIAQDAGVVAISAPVDSVPVGSNVTVAIDVKNFGTDPLTSIPVSYTIGGTTETATFTIPAPGLLPDSVKTYTFATGFTAPNTDFNICAKAEMNDAHPQNDETCKQVQVTMAPIDVKTIGLSVDPSWNDTTKITFDNTVKVQVVNNGTTTLTSINLEYSVGSSVKGTGTWTGSLASLDTLVYTFTDTYKAHIGYYQICAKATVTGDADNTNDELCKNYFGLDNVGIAGSQADGFSVKQNRPNPAHGKAIVDFNIPQSGKVHFELRNALGQVIITEELDCQAGQNQIDIDAASLTSGIYYYTIVFNNHRITKKMLVNN